LIRHGPHRKRGVQQFFCSCACIRCRGNVSTEPSPINDIGIHMLTHKLMGRIYEVRHSDVLRCHDIHAQFLKDWFSYSKVDKVDTQTHRHTDIQIAKAYVYFFLNKASSLNSVNIKYMHEDEILRCTINDYPIFSNDYKGYTLCLYLNILIIIQLNSVRVYLRANLTAQMPITKLERVHRNTQK
jgi:hypothetical protein